MDPRTHLRRPAARAALAVLMVTAAIGVGTSSIARQPGRRSSSRMNTQPLPRYIERPTDAAGVFAIWPGDGVPPDAKSWDWHEQSMTAPAGMGSTLMVRNVVVPTLTMFAPSRGSDTAIIVAPGGAYHFLMMEHEGYDVVRWLAQQGVTAFVLRYRLARTPDNDVEMPAFLQNLFEVLPHPDRAETNPPVGTPATEQARRWAEEDGRQAIRVARQRATEFRINAQRIGIMGFSAGGGIAVNAALEHDQQSRPDFVGGIYAGYRLVNAIPSDLPPLFLAIADDDAAVAPVSLSRLYETWHRAGAPVELHVFANSGHGFGSNTLGRQSDRWRELFRGWLTSRGYLSAEGSRRK
jgi:acetyl esterase/lipase